ncbi:hypothetical protein BU035_02340 [Staphylococcus simulans]|nr:hypothetical protein BU035_02340 [Staphylococcus simulans]
MIQQTKTAISLKVRRKRNSSIDSNRINLIKKSQMMMKTQKMKRTMNKIKKHQKNLSQKKMTHRKMKTLMNQKKLVRIKKHQKNLSRKMRQN